MRPIEIEEGVSIRFLSRSEDFADGFEAGLLAAALAQLPQRHDAVIAAASAPAIAKLARCYGYRLIKGPEENGMVRLCLIRADIRPRFHIVPSAQAPAAE